MLRSLRCCVEQTDASPHAIAKAHGLPPSTVRDLIRREGWRRPGEPAPEAEDPAATASAAAEAEPPAVPEDLVERLERAVAREIAVLEASRRVPPRRAGSAADTERVVRSLERLTDTLAKVRRMREPAASDPDDDLPRDIDEFRRVLARRIEQIVRGGTDGDAAGGDAAGDPAPDRG
ncbi:hypothetical protein PQJ75_24420 [Rhodoplanes sp. TEM]|uniref:Uncharacterized protein n=1 Tax=Rhodoplanes tepidamans TaxID=200616 RepID=A0ABT5JD23_RHOTP|nr:MULTISPECIES: hypothetical protein [Rhodoplanes]MDC7787588.1 hypothetical protein [Rhodoplanes tepidamans]MDC7986887.1 hypothetical protein [Rhodoplanes sp. TEM]MDQ0358016.1 hypothetical protein [Rhodoplanes tepidamans]